MPTNQNAYNSRVTDESLEKRFRDTFRSQGGAELVDDLYASGVIVPVVDFTQAATGEVLAQNLQTAWDFSTGYNNVANTTTQIINTAGFWQLDVNVAMNIGSGTKSVSIFISDGVSNRVVWEFNVPSSGTAGTITNTDGQFVVFVRSNDTVSVTSDNANAICDVWYRQIATVNGDLVDPTGFTSS